MTILLKISETSREKYPHIFVTVPLFVRFICFLCAIKKWRTYVIQNFYLGSTIIYLSPLMTIERPILVANQLPTNF